MVVSWLCHGVFQDWTPKIIDFLVSLLDQHHAVSVTQSFQAVEIAGLPGHTSKLLDSNLYNVALVWFSK